MSLREVNIIQRKNYVAFSLKVVFLNMLPNHRDLRPLLIGNRSNRTQVSETFSKWETTSGFCQIINELEGSKTQRTVS
jgi:hypothetical protein